MGTTYTELIRQVMQRLSPKVEGEAYLAARQGINDAHKMIAATKDFDELMAWDTTHASTVVYQSSYHITTDLALVRPKDIYSIRYMDTDNSRKLTYVPFRELDTKIPYTAITGYNKPSWYTTRGLYVELYPIPDEAKSLYIMHSQWPAVLSNDSDETPYNNIDHVIVALATDISKAILEGGDTIDWFTRAQKYLGLAISEETTRPDRTQVAQPFNPGSNFPVGEYWYNPFIKKQP